VTMTASPFVVQCPSCASEFPVDPGKVPPAGVHAICSVCLRVFQVTVPTVAAEFTDGAPDWIPDGAAVAGVVPGFPLGVSLEEDLEGEVGTSAPGVLDVDDSVREGEETSVAGWFEGGPEVEEVSDFEAIPDFEAVPDFEVDSDADQVQMAEDLEVSEDLEVTETLEWSEGFGVAGPLDISEPVEAAEPLKAEDSIEVADPIGVTDALEVADSLETASPIEVEEAFQVVDLDADSLYDAEGAVRPEESVSGELDPEVSVDREGGEGLDIPPDVSVRAEFDIGDDPDGGTHLLIEEDFEERGDLGELDELITLEAEGDPAAALGVEFGPLDDFGPLDGVTAPDAVEVEEEVESADPESAAPGPEPMDATEPASLEGVADSPLGTAADTSPGFQDLTSLAQEALAESTGAGEGAPVDSAWPGATLASGAPRFGRRDPSERARHLARVLVSDIIAYHPERYRESFAQGTLQEDFRAEVDKSWKEYVDQVGLELAESTPYFREALNDVLGQGRHLF